MRRWFLLALLACGEATEPDASLVGPYAYTFELPATPGITPARSYAGALNVTYASSDSIGCSWSVAGYETPCLLGFRVSGNYLVYARRREGATVNHTLRIDAGSLACESARVGFTNGVNIVFIEGRCSLER